MTTRVTRSSMLIFAWSGAFLMAVLFAGALVNPSAPTASADTDQAPLCDWNNGARMSQSLYYMASAHDYNEHITYLFGGLNKDLDVQSFMQAIDFKGAASPADGKTSTKRNGTARLFGSTAFYRPNPDAAKKGTVYVLFGSKDPGSPSGSGAAGGRGEDTVYAYEIETNSWRVVTTGGLTLGERLFAAAEYDPVNDVAIVTGGVKKCSLAEVLGGAPCSADAFETLVLTFDPAGNITADRGPAGGPRTVYGHSMTYDTTSGRMLAHGGTTNGTSALSATWSLEMGDLTTLSWSRLGSGGPSVVGHSSAHWPGSDWLVVHGGASNAPATPRENVNTKTSSLTLGPAGLAWLDLSATTSPTERMAANAEYVDNGVWQTVVVVGGRTSFDTRGSSVAANYNYLTCILDPGSIATETPAPATATTDPGAAPTFTPEIPIPSPTAPPADPDAKACPQLEMRVPRAAIDAALANPATVAGWGQRCWHHLKPSPWNPLRQYLNLVNANKPYHPQYNPLVYECGCL